MLKNLRYPASFKELPEGVISLCFIQIFSTMSYSVLYATLVLFLPHKLHFTAVQANSVTGVFIAYNYALHMLGGYLGGRFISYRGLFCFGMLCQIVGCIILSFFSEQLLYAGLGAFLTGAGLNVTCINCMLTQRFRPNDSRRETVFLWNYAMMNIGFLAGFTISGYFQLSHRYEQLFLLAALGNLFALFLSLLCWEGIKDKTTLLVSLAKEEKKKKRRIGMVWLIGLPIVLTQLTHYASLANKIVIVSGIAIFISILFLAYKEDDKKSREKILAFLILTVLSTVFWMLYQTAPMGMMQFIEHNVDRHWMGAVIAPQWFQNINSVCIIIGGPLLGVILTTMRAKGFQVNIPTQFTFALLLIGVAFIILPLGIEKADVYGYVSPSWIISCYVLQSIGELLISPIGYAMVGALAPMRYQGVMMGAWMLDSGFAATLSVYSSNMMVKGQTSVLPLATNNNYSAVFFQLGLIALAAGLLLALMIPKLKKLIREDNVETEASSGLLVES